MPYEVRDRINRWRSEDPAPQAATAARHLRASRPSRDGFTGAATCSVLRKVGPIVTKIGRSAYCHYAPAPGDSLPSFEEGFYAPSVERAGFS